MSLFVVVLFAVMFFLVRAIDLCRCLLFVVHCFFVVSGVCVAVVVVVWYCRCWLLFVSSLLPSVLWFAVCRGRGGLSFVVVGCCFLVLYVVGVCYCLLLFVVVIVVRFSFCVVVV